VEGLRRDIGSRRELGGFQAIVAGLVIGAGGAAAILLDHGGEDRRVGSLFGALAELDQGAEISNSTEAKNAALWLCAGRRDGLLPSTGLAPLASLEFP